MGPSAAIGSSSVPGPSLTTWGAIEAAEAGAAGWTGAGAHATLAVTAVAQHTRRQRVQGEGRLGIIPVIRSFAETQNPGAASALTTR
jgi:hypothetical protein